MPNKSSTMATWMAARAVEGRTRYLVVQGANTSQRRIEPGMTSR